MQHPIARAKTAQPVCNLRAAVLVALSAQALPKAPSTPPEITSDHECAFNGMREYATAADRPNPNIAAHLPDRCVGAAINKVMGQTTAEIAECPLNPVKSKLASPIPQPRKASFEVRTTRPTTVSAIAQLSCHALQPRQPASNRTAAIGSSRRLSPSNESRCHVEGMRAWGAQGRMRQHTG